MDTQRIHNLTRNHRNRPMDDDYQIIAETFQDVIHTIALAVDDLAAPIQDGVAALTATLLQEGKIIICGNGVDASTAQLLSSNLLGCFEQERPALPALVLGCDSASTGAIATWQGFDDIFSRQVRALGQPGDLLVCISSGSGASNLTRAAQAAIERNMSVLALSNPADTELADLMQATGAMINCNAARRPRVVELHTMVIHLLCELTDHSLFGNHNGSP